MSQAPVLVYPDPNKPYTLYTDASKYAWAGVLTQECTTIVDGKEVTLQHPITYISGLFQGSQVNWATLTKEAYAIYISCKKLSFYLVGAKTTLQSDHLPLKKFLHMNTMNSKVNNWAVEIGDLNLTFEFIKGIKNTLADSLSHLVDLDLTETQAPEPPGQELLCV